MTITTPASGPLSPHIDCNDKPKQKRRLLLEGFFKPTPTLNHDKFCGNRTSSFTPQPVNRHSCDTEPMLQAQVAPRRRRKCSRSVSFSPTRVEIESLHYKDYTAEEFHATWYTNREWDAMKQERRALIKRMDNINKINWEHLERSDVCVRGLESKTDIARIHRYAGLAAVVAAVLDAQKLQMRRGDSDAQAIADVCEMHTRQSTVQARHQGLKDAIMAGRRC
ncbi:hypothetical protein IV203_022122 [Nitzschia inconspicua]|uniref:Uncharacterized protein n=1 Tax=Nitzschia inconspicua TaxID=303405 RepID=A0A9K3PGJ4_9STRA|nr:hypothetical protein IV203_022122 [Nitzschia inconspicua]